MTELERGWVAGFIEGEGSFSASRSNSVSYYPRVEATNTDLSCLVRLRQYAGGTISGPYQQTGRWGTKPVYRWRLTKSHLCWELIDDIKDLMSDLRLTQIQVMREKCQSSPKYASLPKYEQLSLF